MNDELEARVAALETLVVRIGKATQEPVLDLLDWLGEEQVHDLGSTRGTLLALQAFCRAVASVCTDRAALVRAFDESMARAEADALMLQLPERSMTAARAALADTAAALRRDLEAPRAVGQ